MAEFTQNQSEILASQVFNHENDTLNMQEMCTDPNVSSTPVNKLLNLVKTDSTDEHDDKNPKKKGSFQIMSVKSRGGSGEHTLDGESIDDMDESKTDDISDRNESDVIEEDRGSTVISFKKSTNEISKVDHEMKGPEPIVNESDKDKTDIQMSRFKIVKIKSKQPFKKGRWSCYDFMDAPVEKEKVEEKEPVVTSDCSSATSSIHFVPGIDDPCKNPLDTSTPLQAYAPDTSRLTHIPEDSHITNTVYEIGGIQNLPNASGASNYDNIVSKDKQTDIQSDVQSSEPVREGAKSKLSYQDIRQEQYHVQHVDTRHIENMVLHSDSHTTLGADTASQNISVHSGPPVHVHDPVSQRTDTLNQEKQSIIPVGQMPSSQTPQQMTDNRILGDITHQIQMDPNIELNALDSTKTVLLQSDKLQYLQPPTKQDVQSSSVQQTINMQDFFLQSHGHSLQQEDTGLPELDRSPSLLTSSLAPPLLEIVTASATGPLSPGGEEQDNRTQGDAVAIDNKIEQAMDLVKSHLMFAVREEIEVLKDQITQLVDKNSQLEIENSILKGNATSETLAQLQQGKPPNQSSNMNPPS